VAREELREEIRRKRQRQPRDLIEEKSREIKNRLFSLNEYWKAEIVTFYVAKKSDGEVDTEEMIRETLKTKKKVLVPITDRKHRRLLFSELRDYDKELGLGIFGIPEPKEAYRRIVSPEFTDLVIVPGIVFDVRGYRLGYGFGYYDRFLSSLEPETPTVGLAFELQIVDRIPEERHDIPVQRIVTERREIDTRL